MMLTVVVILASWSLCLRDLKQCTRLPDFPKEKALVGNPQSTEEMRVAAW